MEQLRADYVVAGAGPAGLTIARLLALKGRKVLVVDPELRTAKRLELLSPASLGTIGALDLMPLLDDPVIARPCLGIRRQWGSAEIQHEDFLSHPYRTGYVVDRVAFDAHLRVAARAAGVDFCRARVSGIQPDRGGVLVQAIEGRSKIDAFAGAAIDATGRAAMIARRMGARMTVRDRMIAELNQETIGEPRSDTPAWLDVQRAGPGWSYEIHGPDGHAQKWTVSRSGAERRRSRALRVDASSGILSEAAGDGWIAIGDAAISFDPIASQGLYNALSSALVATGALVSARGFDLPAARLYSDAIAATFYWSEAERSEVYGGIR